MLSVETLQVAYASVMLHRGEHHRRLRSYGDVAPDTAWAPQVSGIRDDVDLFDTAERELAAALNEARAAREKAATDAELIAEADRNFG